MMNKFTLTPKQTQQLTTLVRASTSPQGIVLRARLILGSAGGSTMSSVATSDAVGRETVRRWCQRWQRSQAERDRLETENQEGSVSETMDRRKMEAIVADAPRSGAPAPFTAEQKRERLAVATRHPEDEGIPVTHWSHDLLAQTGVEQGIVKTISAAHSGRVFKERGLPTAPTSVRGTSHQ